MWQFEAKLTHNSSWRVTFIYLDECLFVVWIFPTDEDSWPGNQHEDPQQDVGSLRTSEHIFVTHWLMIDDKTKS